MACSLSLIETANAIDAKLIGDDLVFSGLSTDTRTICDGQLFVALKGPIHDAHDYVEKALQKGASAVLVDRRLDVDAPQLLVKDTLLSLGVLSRYWRSKFDIPLIGVTGSNGKTTVKEMLFSILSQQSITLATQGNFNNDIGMPLTLLNLGTEHQAAVIEMGANHPGEIEYLTRLALPSVVLITNAAAAHLEGFGSVEGVAKAKGEIYKGLKDDGIAVINVDDDYGEYWQQIAQPHKTVSVALSKDADVTCEWHSSSDGSKLEISSPWGKVNCRLSLLGKHNVMNALLASAAALATGVSTSDVAQGIAALRAVGGRLQLKKAINDAMLIDDTYNANPNSLHAALVVLGGFVGRKILVLGDMGELGEDSLQLHKQVAIDAQKNQVDKMITIGDFSRAASDAFSGESMHFDNHQQIVEKLKLEMISGTTVLVKGSRSMQMEKIVNTLVEQRLAEEEH